MVMQPVRDHHILSEMSVVSTKPVVDVVCGMCVTPFEKHRQITRGFICVISGPVLADKVSLKFCNSPSLNGEQSSGF